MALPKIKYCPGTLAANYTSYSKTILKRLFQGRKVSPILPYDSPTNNEQTDMLFTANRKRMSISGVQEKFSVLLEKNKLRLIDEGEQGQYILKPIPNVGKNASQMPANEHVTMQIARQVFQMETAENALIFFKNGAAAYITKRFDVKDDGNKWAQEDFASLAGRTPQTHGEDFKYSGNYVELFQILKKYTPAYTIESIKLFKLILFNYLFSNGDAHFKNFSLIETPMGDFRLSPAYDLLNSRLHIEDKEFALDDGLLPPNLAQGKITEQFFILGEKAGILKQQVNKVFSDVLSKQNEVHTLIEASFLNEKAKRNYTQAYQTRLKKLTR
ncbi:HipA domain-containing protein [Aureibaculum sp. A20]|uniref:HipA domain-containing protein n=1 Tax=Aureibaculum flavum TaxID=2795986 RepID=A0ABS0WRU5_9FLAO|nr:HipA domain-containing protein [Aureibaculum flavum]MBJ2174706.1 HipA domain-containing protein [Aureibaculum flavum]